MKIISLRKEYKSRTSRILNVLIEILKKTLEIDTDIYHLHDPELLLIAKT